MCDGPFGGRVIDTYLTGSYARDTAVRPLDDVDIVALIRPEAWSTGWFASDPDPTKVLASFAGAIRRRYPDSGVHTQRRSIGLKLYHLDIDVVPAIDEGSNRIRIPDRTKGNWIKSAPKSHTDLGQAVNARRDGKFKPLVKLLKAWNNNLPSTAHMKSFLIETIATRLFDQEPFGTLDEGLLLFFDFLTQFTDADTLFEWDKKCGISFDSWSGVSVPDTANTGSNVAAKVDWSRAERFLSYARQTGNKLEQADAAAYEDTAFRRTCSALRVPIVRSASAR